MLIVKTIANNYDKVKELIQSQISYDNFIGQLKVEKINSNFEKWLLDVVKL